MLWSRTYRSWTIAAIPPPETPLQQRGYLAGCPCLQRLNMYHSLAALGWLAKQWAGLCRRQAAPRRLILGRDASAAALTSA